MGSPVGIGIPSHMNGNKTPEWEWKWKGVGMNEHRWEWERSFRIVIFQRLMSSFLWNCFLFPDCRLFAFTLYCFAARITQRKSHGNGNKTLTWELELGGMGTESVEMGENVNVKIHSRSSLIFRNSIIHARMEKSIDMSFGMCSRGGQGMEY